MESKNICRGCTFRIAVEITVLAILLLAGGAGAATLTVDDSGGANYTRIQDAIDNASNGDTVLVYSGTYYENVNVKKHLTMRGIGMPVVDARGSGSAIRLAADGIVLEGFAATGSGFYQEAGIKVNSNNNTLSGNNASNDSNGIHLDSSSNNTLSGNNASNNNYNGIYLDSSSNDTLSGNNALNNYYGISLDSSSSNMLIGNNASNNEQGLSLWSSSNNTLIGNNASNNNLGISRTLPAKVCS